MNKNYKAWLHRLFKLSILIKGIDGVLDIVASLILFFSAAGTITKIIPFLIRRELLEDPNDIISNYLLVFSQNILPSTQLFVVIYLAVHGSIKIGLALAFNSHNHRAYKVAEVILVMFAGYQAYRFSHTHSLLLLGSIGLDVVVIFLVNAEARRLAQGSSLSKQR